MKLAGEVRRFEEVAPRYSKARTTRLGAQRLFPRLAVADDELASCTVSSAIVTDYFAVIDPVCEYLFLNQSYTGVERLFKSKIVVEGRAFRCDVDPKPIPGETIVIGGPVDRVWYHWLFNWCPRLLLLQRLRPDLLSRRNVKFLVSPQALQEPYFAILETFGFASDRFVVAEPGCDYVLETAHLVSFLDQDKLYPELVRQFADHLLAAFGTPPDRRFAGLFASRQPLPSPRRRVHNFDQILPVLERRRLRVVELGAVPASGQAELFHNAELIVGAHGSDLSNILFCRAGTPVVVIENRESVRHGLHMGLAKLAEVLDLSYHLFVSDTTREPAEGLPQVLWQARDYFVDPAALDRALDEVRTSKGDAAPPAGEPPAVRDVRMRAGSTRATAPAEAP